MLRFTASLTWVAFRAIISDAEAVAGTAANAATTRLRATRKRKLNPLGRKLDWAVRFLHRRKIAELKPYCGISRRDVTPSDELLAQQRAGIPAPRPFLVLREPFEPLRDLLEGRPRLRSEARPAASASLRAGASRSAASAVTARPSGSSSRRGSPPAASSCTARRRAARSSSSPISTPWPASSLSETSTSTCSPPASRDSSVSRNARAAGSPRARIRRCRRVRR